MAKKLVTPAQKQTAAQFKAAEAAEAAKQAAAKADPKPAKAAKPAPAPKAAKDPKPAKAAKPAPAPKAERPKRPEGMPDHWTLSGNKKHQANGPQSWSAVFLAAAKAAALPGGAVREGDGVRIALAIGVAELAKRHGVKLEAAKVDPKQTVIPAVAK